MKASNIILSKTHYFIFAYFFISSIYYFSTFKIHYDDNNNCSMVALRFYALWEKYENQKFIILVKEKSDILRPFATLINFWTKYDLRVKFVQYKCIQM